MPELTMTYADVAAAMQADPIGEPVSQSDKLRRREPWTSQ